MKHSPSHPSPWEKPLLNRLQELTQSDFRVAYFSETFDQGSFRYRCYNMAQALNAHAAGISSSYFVAEDLRALDNLPLHADILVLSRVRYDSQIHRLIDSFRGAGKPVLFDIDDLIFDARFAPLVASNLNFALWGKDIDNWFALTSRIGATLDLCDSVITTTDFLADQIREVTGKHCDVVPNFLNQEQLAASAAISKDLDPNTVTLGYFSGSASHQRDFEVAVPNLADFLGADERHRLTIAGYLDLPPALERFTDRVSRLPFMSPVDLQGAIATVDANLVPLQDSAFTASKSELKYFEAAIVGTPTIASPTPPYSSAILDGETGIIARDNNWRDAIARFLALSSEERASLGDRAKIDAEAKFVGGIMAPGLASMLRATSPRQN
jgi:glycosyltransferase involved in cell wall biosynthesis